MRRLFTIPRRGAAGLALALLLAGLPGCGSGGSSPSPVMVCSPTLFTPNYVSDLQSLARWRSLPVTVAFQADPSATADRRAAVLAGFDRWVSATGGVIRYTLVSDPTAAEISIHFVAQMADSLSDISLLGDEVTHVDMAIGTQDPGTNQPLPSADITCSSAHELGHALGIEGHSTNPADLMYFAHVVGTQCPITTRDLDTMKTAYCDLFLAGSRAVRSATPGTPWRLVIHERSWKNRWVLSDGRCGM